MKKLLAIVLSVLMVFAVTPMALVSAETIQTVVFTMDEGSAPSSWSTDKRYTVTPGIIDSGNETYGKVLQLGTFGDQGSLFQFPGSAINTEIGIPTKITLDMKAGANFNVENGMALVAGGTWYKVSDSFYTGTSWRTITIDLTENNKYYSNISTAISKGINSIGFNKNKATSYILVDNVTVYTELFSENREEQAKPDAPVVESFTGNTITVKAVENALYSKDGGATWQSSNKFTGLKGDTDYELVIKLKQSATHFESPMSDITIGTTAAVYKWNIYSDYFTIASGATIKGNFSTQYANNGTYYIATGVTAGQTVTFVSKTSLKAGIYAVNMSARSYSGRAPIDIAINGQTVAESLNTSNKNGATGNDLSYALSEFTLEQDGTVEIVLTATGSGSLYLNAFEFAKVADLVEKPIYKVTIGGVEGEYKEGTKISLPALETGYHYTDGVNNYNPGDVYEVTGDATLTVELNTYDVTIDGTVVDTVAHGGTYTVATPKTGYDYTDGTTTYVGGEVLTVTAPVAITSTIKMTKYVYTMDEGSRVEYGATCNIGNGNDGATYEEVDGNYKLALKAKSDQCTYFKLPADWSSKPYYKPVSISFKATKTAGKNVQFRNLDFSDAITGNFSATGNVYKVSTSLTGLPTSYSFDVTEDMYGYCYISAKYYSEGWSADAPVYAYIDDITITYEYDFDYVEKDGETTDAISTTDGASIRLNNVNGMRFYTTVDPEKLAELVGDNDYEIGTLIAPADKVGENLTVEDVHSKVVYDHVNWELWEGNQFVGSIVNLKKSNKYNVKTGNLARDFVARGYVKVGDTYYYSETVCVRNMAQIADAYIDQADSGYKTLSADIKALVDEWAAAND